MSCSSYWWWVVSYGVKCYLVRRGSWFYDLNYHETVLAPLSRRFFLSYTRSCNFWACFIGLEIYMETSTPFNWMSNSFKEVLILIDIEISITAVGLVGSHGSMRLLGLCLFHWPPSGKPVVERYFSVKSSFSSYILSRRSSWKLFPNRHKDINLMLNDQSWNIVQVLMVPLIRNIKYYLIKKQTTDVLCM